MKRRTKVTQRRTIKEGVIHVWRGPEFIKDAKSKNWYLIATLILSVIIIYALIKNSPIMAITFILIGIVGYIQIQREPQILDFAITHDGLIVGKELYTYDTIHSFWIFYEPPHVKILSLRTRGSIVPHIHIPIHEEDPNIIHEKLSQFIPEKKQEHTLVDTIERMLHI